MWEGMDNRRRRPDRKRCCVCRRWYFKKRKDQVTCARESCRKARKLWWQRQNKKSGVCIKNHVKRFCLKCGQPFWSYEFRICNKCSDYNIKYNGYANIWG